MSCSKEKSGAEEEEGTEQHAELEDKDLDDLLESALEDFSKPITSSGASNVSSKENETKDIAGMAAKEDLKWCNEFLTGDTSAFDEAIRSILTEDPEIAEGVKRFAEIANKAANGEVTDEEIGNLTQNFLSSTASGDNASALSEDFSKLFENLKLNENEPVDENSFPQMTTLMQNVMQMLLSKDLLYPALKDISIKYPGWLEENKNTMPPEKFEKYDTQQRVILNICNEFESETADDPADMKQQRYERILDLMQKLQDCGQPPAELIGDMGAVECDENGLPKLPGLSADMNDRCSLM